VAAHIEGDDVKAVAELSGERVERLRAPGIAMDANHGRRIGISPIEIMHAQIVDRQGLIRRL
jgi:hypothetical protein